LKLRIKGNSVRLRLEQREVAQLHTVGVVREVLRFGPLPEDVFAYAIETNSGDGLRVQYRSCNLVVSLPKAWADLLATTDQIGYEARVEVAPGVCVGVLVEKDFRCLEAREGEVETDRYPHP
jgi:hypothetical protein